jgi:hypothetical protein
MPRLSVSPHWVNAHGRLDRWPVMRQYNILNFGRRPALREQIRTRRQIRSVCQTVSDSQGCQSPRHWRGQVTAHQVIQRQQTLINHLHHVVRGKEALGEGSQVEVMFTCQFSNRGLHLCLPKQGHLALTRTRHHPHYPAWYPSRRHRRP